MKKMKWILGLLLAVTLVLAAAVAMGENTLPSAIGELCYTGSEIVLINAGTIGEGGSGVYWYKLGDGEATKSASDITGTDAGVYKVYYGVGTETEAPAVMSEYITATIGKATISISWEGIVLTSSYTGSAVTAPSATVTGGNSGDYEVSASWKNGTEAINAGDYSVVTTVSLNDTAKADNYTNTFDEGKITGENTYTITPQGITVEWSTTGNSKEYDGDDWKPTYASVSPESASSVLEVGYTGNQKQVTTEGFTATASVKAENTQNYTVNANSGRFYRTPKEITTITWVWTDTDNKTNITYDGKIHTAKATAVGVGDETLDLSGSIEYDKTPSADVGSYTATLKAGSYNTNYTLTTAGTSELTIDKKEITINWALDDAAWPGSNSIVYDKGEHTISASTGDFIDSDTVTLSVSEIPDKSDVKNAKQYTAKVSLSGEKSNNYSIANDTVVLNITPKDIGNSTVSITGIDDEYIYTGSPITDEDSVIVSDESDKLAKVTDYTIQYSNAHTNVSDSPVTITIKGAGNYAEATTLTFTILPKQINAAWAASIADQVYTGSPIIPALTITDPERNNVVLTLDQDYEVSCDDNVNVADDPVVTVTGKNNYKGSFTTTFTIVPKTIEEAWAASIADQVYTGSPIEPVLTITDPERNVVLTLDQDYEVKYEDNVNVADKPVVTVKGINNYEGSFTTTFTIDPKTIEGAWADSIANQVYTGSPIEPVLTITDPERNVVLTLDQDYEVKYEDNVNVADKPVVTVKGINNYEGEFTMTFKIDPKDIGLEDIVFEKIDDQVYTTKKIEPTVVVNDTNPLKNAKLVLDTDYTITYSNNILVSDTTELGHALVKIKGIGNYKGENSTTFLIIRKKVEPIKITVNGPVEDTSRLGGPDEAKYHTITIAAEAGEKLIVTISKDGEVLATVKDLVAGDVEIENDAILGAELDGSGDVGYKIEVEYADKINLTTENESASAAAAPAVDDTFFFDTQAKSIEAAPVKNRTAPGVDVTLKEGYRLVKFTSKDAGQDFTATNKESLKAGEHTIAFDNYTKSPKLNSTVKYGSSFSGVYEDYVGNPGTFSGGEIVQESGTISIDSVEPDINTAGRIGNTPTLTFQVTMSAPGGFEELAHGSVFGDQTLQQRTHPITISASSLAADTANTPSLNFDDLVGGDTFRSFIYDPVCDDPVLTVEPYEGSHYLMGIAEPYAQIVMEVNGERRTCSADAFGVFALDMPLTEAGDIITLRVTDQAGNTSYTQYRVGPEADDIDMLAFMAGRVYTNAHGLKEGNPDWTMILTASVDDLKAGNVNVPIIAGNMVSVGTMSVKMDESNNISYSYTLDDGVQLQKEQFIVNNVLDKDAFIAGVGIEVDPNGTLITDIKGGKVYLSCRMVVKVPAEMLKSTFQTEKVKNSEMKRLYRDIQNGKLN